MSLRHSEIYGFAIVRDVAHGQEFGQRMDGNADVAIREYSPNIQPKVMNVNVERLYSVLVSDLKMVH